jgi:hypothetical protein
VKVIPAETPAKVCFPPGKETGIVLREKVLTVLGGVFWAKVKVAAKSRASARNFFMGDILL